MSANVVFRSLRFIYRAVKFSICFLTRGLRGRGNLARMLGESSDKIMSMLALSISGSAGSSLPRS